MKKFISLQKYLWWSGQSLERFRFRSYDDQRINVFFTNLLRIQHYYVTLISYVDKKNK